MKGNISTGTAAIVIVVVLIVVCVVGFMVIKKKAGSEGAEGLPMGPEAVGGKAGGTEMGGATEGTTPTPAGPK
ncbi:MAG TPA: hypothetical protein QGH10_09615 [Armatimonadota bacterium]|nr:hypothetical protein [Armatimonadota bacterium]